MKELVREMPTDFSQEIERRYRQTDKKSSEKFVKSQGRMAGKQDI